MPKVSLILSGYSKNIALEIECGDEQCVPHEQVSDFVTYCVNQMDESIVRLKGQRSNANILMSNLVDCHAEIQLW